MRECCKPGFQKSWKPGDEEMHQVQRIRRGVPYFERGGCSTVQRTQMRIQQVWISKFEAEELQARADKPP